MRGKKFIRLIVELHEPRQNEERRAREAKREREKRERQVLEEKGNSVQAFV